MRINPHHHDADSCHVQGFPAGRGDDRIRTGEPVLSTMYTYDRRSANAAHLARNGQTWDLFVDSFEGAHVSLDPSVVTRRARAVRNRLLGTQVDDTYQEARHAPQVSEHHNGVPQGHEAAGGEPQVPVMRAEVRAAGRARRVGVPLVRLAQSAVVAVLAALALATTASAAPPPMVCSAECANGGGNCYEGSFYFTGGGWMVCRDGEWTFVRFP